MESLNFNTKGQEDKNMSREADDRRYDMMSILSARADVPHGTDSFLDAWNVIAKVYGGA